MSKAHLHVRLDEALKQALLAAADDEKRSLSNLVIKILEDWLADRSKPDFLSESLNSGDGTYRP